MVAQANAAVTCSRANDDAEEFTEGHIVML